MLGTGPALHSMACCHGLTSTRFLFFTPAVNTWCLGSFDGIDKDLMLFWVGDFRLNWKLQAPCRNRNGRIRLRMKKKPFCSALSTLPSPTWKSSRMPGIAYFSLRFCHVPNRIFVFNISV